MMTMSADVVASFLRARSERPGWVPVPDAHRPQSIAEGYRVQKAVHEAIEASGKRRVGYKVGATSEGGQRSFGIEEPMYAGMFTDNQAPDLATALAAPLLAPSLECEIAFRMNDSLDGRAGAVSREAAAAAVGACFIACEVIDNRYADPKAVGVPTLLVEEFFHASFVLGPENRDWRTLALNDLEASITIDGAVARGHSSGVLDALTSLQWLVGKLAGTDLFLRAGDIVMTGSIVPPTPIRLPAKRVWLSIAGFAPLGFGAA